MSIELVLKFNKKIKSINNKFIEKINQIFFLVITRIHTPKPPTFSFKLFEIISKSEIHNKFLLIEYNVLKQHFFQNLRTCNKIRHKNNFLNTWSFHSSS